MKNHRKQQLVVDIHNERTDKLITEAARICDSWWQKAIGLMFAKKPFDLIMRFKQPKIVTLHMFFVFFPIDVLWLDESGKVVELKERFFPFRTYRPKHLATAVVELRVGTIGETGTKVGDRILIREKSEDLSKDIKNSLPDTQ